MIVREAAEVRIDPWVLAQTKTPPRRTAFSNSWSQGLAAWRWCTWTGRARSAGTGRGWSGQAAFTLGALASQLAGTTNGLSLLTRLLLRGLLVVVAQLHFAEDAFALQLFLQRAQRLINVIIANDYLQRSTALSKLVKCVWMEATEQKSLAADQQSQSPWVGL